MPRRSQSPSAQAPASTSPDLERIARFFAALADPTRLHLLHLLQSGERSVGELTTATAVKQAAVSKQLGILRDHGLLARRRAGNHIYYSIADEVVFTLCHAVCGKVERDAQAALTAAQAG
ncbi:MAG: ArsR family transcriptional regulator [Planctomycetota bacterium]|nr:MAG: ArsR family transcriptional regulator [Planctomycetota bacterium]